MTSVSKIVSFDELNLNIAAGMILDCFTHEALKFGFSSSGIDETACFRQSSCGRKIGKIIIDHQTG